MNEVDERAWASHCAWLRRVRAVHRAHRIRLGQPPLPGPSEWRDDPVFRGDGDDDVHTQALDRLPPLVERQNACLHFA